MTNMKYNLTASEKLSQARQLAKRDYIAKGNNEQDFVFYTKTVYFKNAVNGYIILMDINN